MINEPLPHLFGLLIILFAKFFEVDLLEVIPSLCRAQMVLPGTRKKLVHIVVQVAVDQHVPLVLVEPDPIATAAAVDVKLGIGEDLVTCHDMTAIRAKL